MNRETLLQYAEETYGAKPEYLWASSPESAVLRHRSNRKWFAALLLAPRSSLGVSGQGRVFVLNVKTDPMMTGSLILQDGIFAGYHMNKQNWISILLDGTVEEEQIKLLLDTSYRMTQTAGRR